MLTVKNAARTLDAVALIEEDLPERSLHRGQVGTVVEALSPDTSSRSSSQTMRDVPSPRPQHGAVSHFALQISKDLLLAHPSQRHRGS